MRGIDSENYKIRKLNYKINQVVSTTNSEQARVIELKRKVIL